MIAVHADGPVSALHVRIHYNGRKEARGEAEHINLWTHLVYIAHPYTKRSCNLLLRYAIWKSTVHFMQISLLFHLQMNTQANGYSSIAMPFVNVHDLNTRAKSRIAYCFLILRNDLLIKCLDLASLLLSEAFISISYLEFDVVLIYYLGTSSIGVHGPRCTSIGLVIDRCSSTPILLEAWKASSSATVLHSWRLSTSHPLL